MGVAQDLWHDSADLAAACLAHPFVRGLADGTLPRSAFAEYVAQDAYFLESFVRAYALALAHSPDRAGVDAFGDLLAGARAEIGRHASYARSWGIDLSIVEPAPATVAYTDFLLATAALSGVGQTCAAMTPCMRLYAHLGQSLSREHTSDAYADWIAAYADPAFEALAATLERLCDTYVEEVDRVRTTYRRAMRLELAFFDGVHHEERRHGH